MTNYDWAKLAIKLIGLWLMISAATSAANAASLFGFEQFRATAALFSFLYPLVTGIAGVLVWRRADGLAVSMFPAPAAATGDSSFSQGEQEHLFVLALSVIGVWFVSQAIVTLIYNFALLLIRRSPLENSVFGRISYREIEQSGIWAATAKANIVAAAARALVGLGLLVGSRRLSDLIAAMRGRTSSE